LTFALVPAQISHLDIATIKETAHSLHPTNIKEGKWKVCKNLVTTKQVKPYVRQAEIRAMSKLR
jgi:hypothetical protein